MIGILIMIYWAFMVVFSEGYVIDANPAKWLLLTSTEIFLELGAFLAWVYLGSQK